MKNHHRIPILIIFLLTVVAISVGCTPSSANTTKIPNLQLTQNPTDVPLSSLTATAELITPNGILIYSDSKTVYAVGIQSRNIKPLFKSSGFERILVSENYIHIANQTSSTYDDAQFKSYRVNLDGTGRHQYTLADGSTYQSYEIRGVSPDERYIAYYKPGKLIIIDTVSEKIQEISEPISHGFLSIAWSIDSKNIFLVDMKFQNAVGEHMQILRYAIDTGKTTEILSEFPDPEFRWYLEGGVWNWSPDGRNLLINYAGIYLFNTESRKLETIETKGIATDFVWSPNGKQVLFHTMKDQEQTESYILDIQNDKIENISDFMPNQSFSGCSWSPTGEMILCEALDQHLYLVDLNKKTATDIVWVGGLKVESRTTTDYVWHFHPTWSPDSQYFAYLTMSNPDSSPYDQDYVLNIQSVKTGAHLQIPIPREKDIEEIHWR